jgi:hypothetical protein
MYLVEEYKLNHEQYYIVEIKEKQILMTETDSRQNAAKFNKYGNSGLMLNIRPEDVPTELQMLFMNDRHATMSIDDSTEFKKIVFTFND